MPGISAPFCLAAGEAAGDGVADGADAAGGVAKGWGTPADGEPVPVGAAGARLPDELRAADPEPGVGAGVAAWGCPVGVATAADAGAVRRGLATAGAVALPCGLGAGPLAGLCAGTAGPGVAAAWDAAACRGMVCEVGA